MSRYNISTHHLDAHVSQEYKAECNRYGCTIIDLTVVVAHDAIDEFSLGDAEKTLSTLKQAWYEQNPSSLEVDSGLTSALGVSLRGEIL